MTLDEYLTSKRLSAAEFGRSCDPPLHRTEVWNYRTGRRLPRADKVDAIEKATQGQVRAGDFSSRE
jgi:hypothetical protein